MQKQKKKKLETCRSLNHGKINKILLFLVLCRAVSYSLLLPVPFFAGCITLIVCTNSRDSLIHIVFFVSRLHLKQYGISSYRTLCTLALTKVWILLHRERGHNEPECITKITNKPYTRIALRMSMLLFWCVRVCGVHELSLLFRWILSVCLLFFAECLNKGKQIWHMCSTKKRSEIGRDSEEEEDAKRNVPYSMQINEQISFFELNEKQTKQIFSTRHENYAHGMCVIGEMGQGNSIVLFTASLLLQLLLSYWFVCMR